MEDEVKVQFKMRIPPQLVDRLDRLAAKCGFSSAQQFAAEALDLYADRLAILIIELKKIQAEAIERQGEELLADLRGRQRSGPGRRK